MGRGPRPPSPRGRTGLVPSPPFPPTGERAGVRGAAVTSAAGRACPFARVLSRRRSAGWPCGGARKRPSVTALSAVAEARRAGARPGVPRADEAAQASVSARHWPCSRLRTIDPVRTQVGLRAGAGPPRRPLHTAPNVRAGGGRGSRFCDRVDLRRLAARSGVRRRPPPQRRQRAPRSRRDAESSSCAGELSERSACAPRGHGCASEFSPAPTSPMSRHGAMRTTRGARTSGRSRAPRRATSAPIASG